MSVNSDFASAAGGFSLRDVVIRPTVGLAELRRLHSIAQNSRFLNLPGCHWRNLASRMLGLSLRRLSADIRVRYGHPVLLAETFVNPARFAGTRYRAANRGPVGFTPGYARRPAAAPHWVHHGQAKETCMYELTPGARAALSALDEGGDWRD